MTDKKKSKKLTPEELAASTVFPINLTKAQQKEADAQLAEARKRTQAEMTEGDRLSLKLFQLKFQLEEYLESKDYNPTLTFGYFLKEYVGLLNRKRKIFAEEISIDQTLLSQLINMHRIPPDYVAVRLEIHSNNTIPANYWLKLVGKQKEYYIKTDKELRRKESQYVHNKLSLSL